MICPNCDRRIPEDSEICEYCGKPLPQQEEEEYEEELVLENEPKPLRGFLGALLGALVSGAVIVLLPRLGLMPAFGGILVAFLVFIGYRLLNKNMTKIGVGVCIMFTLITPYVAHQAIQAIWIMENVKEYEGIAMNMSFMETFFFVPIAIELDIVNVIEYFMGLLRLYLFTAVGGVAYLGGRWRARRKAKQQEPRHL